MLIYLVMADVSYEGSTPVRAFYDKQGAENFQQKCYAHRSKAPDKPNEPPCDTPENDALYERFFQKSQRWAKRHPAGEENALCDTFSVLTVPFNPPPRRIQHAHSDKQTA